MTLLAAIQNTWKENIMPSRPLKTRRIAYLKILKDLISAWVTALLNIRRLEYLYKTWDICTDKPPSSAPSIARTILWSSKKSTKTLTTFRSLKKHIKSVAQPAGHSKRPEGTRIIHPYITSKDRKSVERKAMTLWEACWILNSQAWDSLKINWWCNHKIYTGNKTPWRSLAT